MLAFFKSIINLPELFVELMESFDLTEEAQEALDAATALAVD